MRHARLRLLAALAAVSIAGCHSSDDSDDVAPWKPSDIFISGLIEAADFETVKVSVGFVILSPVRDTYRLLNPGDALTVCVGAICRPLQRDPTLRANEHPYVADLPYVAETPYTISLSQENIVTAPNSVVTLPVPFTILAPPAGLSVTDGQQVTVQWSPPNNGVRANVPFDTNGRSSVDGDARCDHDGGAQSTRRDALEFQRVDTGTATVRVDELFEEGYKVGPGPLPQAPVLRCDIVLQVTEGRIGTIDSAFKHGSFPAVVRQSVTIEYTPSQR